MPTLAFVDLYANQLALGKVIITDCFLGDQSKPNVLAYFRRKVCNSNNTKAGLLAKINDLFPALIRL